MRRLEFLTRTLRAQNPLRGLLAAAAFFGCGSTHAADWFGGSGNWSNDSFWSTGFVPGPGEDVWINAAGGSVVNFDVPAATVAELRLGNGQDNQVFNVPAGTLTITANSLTDGGPTPSWSGRWSANTTTRISGTGKIEVTNVGQEAIPYMIAGNEGPGGDLVQNAQFVVEGSGQLIVSDGGAPLDANGNATAGSLNVAQWREARATTTVRGNGLIDVAGDLGSNSGGWTLLQEGGQINVGVNFYLDRFDAIDGLGRPAQGLAHLTGGVMNVGWNFHVVQNGKGEFNVRQLGQLDVDNVLKVNDVFPAATAADGDGALNITEGGLVRTRFLEVPTSAQLVNDKALLNLSGGMLVIEESAVETTSGPLGSQTGSISDDVADWINRGFLTGSLGTVNRTPGVNIPNVSSLGDLTWGRASVADGGALYIWTQDVVGLSGDFNGDGIVSADDYTVWRDNLGSPNENALNGNGDGANGVDTADYNLWRANYGGTSSAGALAAVPEPVSILMLATLVGNLAATRRRGARG